MRIAICEDTPMEADFLLEMLGQYRAERPYLQVEADVYGSAEALSCALRDGLAYDLYLLDIIMPGMDGMEMARLLRKNGEECTIIFLTSSPDFAVEAFTVKATDYLVKPVQKWRLFGAVDDAVAALGSKVEPKAVIMSRDGDVTVKRADIVAVEVIGHTLTYTLVGGRQVESKVLRISFEQATADLLADARFFSPHRSFVINLASVQAIERDGVLLAGGVRVPLSRLRGTALRRAYAEYLGNTLGKEEP